jgi:hypothetical protein
MTIKRLVSRIIEVRAFVGGWDALVRRSLHVVRRDGFAAFGHKVLTISGVRGGGRFTSGLSWRLRLVGITNRAAICGDMS